MSEAAQPGNGIKESVARIAEKMEQDALTKNQLEYFGARVVALRNNVLQLQAALNEANAEVERLKALLPKDNDPEPEEGDVSEEDEDPRQPPEDD